VSNEPRIFEPAETQYNDWRGTSALDEGDDPDGLCSLFKLDREKWAIVGVSIFGTYGDASWASVYALERELLDKARAAAGDDWPSHVAAEHDGRLPVTEFDLHEESAAMRVLSIHKQWSIRAKAGQPRRSRDGDRFLARRSDVPQRRWRRGRLSCQLKG